MATARQPVPEPVDLAPGLARLIELLDAALAERRASPRLRGYELSSTRRLDHAGLALIFATEVPRVPVRPPPPAVRCCLGFCGVALSPVRIENDRGFMVPAVVGHAYALRLPYELPPYHRGAWPEDVGSAVVELVAQRGFPTMPAATRDRLPFPDRLGDVLTIEGATQLAALILELRGMNRRRAA